MLSTTGLYNIFVNSNFSFFLLILNNSIGLISTCIVVFVSVIVGFGLIFFIHVHYSYSVVNFTSGYVPVLEAATKTPAKLTRRKGKCGSSEYLRLCDCVYLERVVAAIASSYENPV